jgi:hypothetical protein
MCLEQVPKIPKLEMFPRLGLFHFKQAVFDTLAMNPGIVTSLSALLQRILCPSLQKRNNLRAERIETFLSSYLCFKWSDSPFLCVKCNCYATWLGPDAHFKAMVATL